MTRYRAFFPAIALLILTACAPTPVSHDDTSKKFLAAVHKDGRNSTTSDAVALSFGKGHCELRRDGNTLVQSRETLETLKDHPETLDLVRIMAAAEVILCPEVKGK